jgi:hypothetical protein
MIDTYLRPPVDAVWADEKLDVTSMVTALDNCTLLLQSLSPNERSSTRWQVLPPLLPLLCCHRGLIVLPLSMSSAGRKITLGCCELDINSQYQKL